MKDWWNERRSLIQQANRQRHSESYKQSLADESNISGKEDIPYANESGGGE